ncbi:cupin domain-containing protein [Algoriphagus sediminis]|uniref:Cupin domain-containing protein n=1 Tax=Algoriphagus sediminis TaxID=3057113 RepID=A0ABT7YC11_9BACT|nr:cupin domain-containing protein [Algoriphagus sediminis]MDN3204066.1 cupin domain-containing protein [Algoriphagus sediminis]
MSKYFFGIIALLLFSCAESNKSIDEIQIETLVESSLSWNGDSLPPYPDGIPKVTILKVSIPPGANLKMHKHLVINAGVLIKGELTVISERGNTLKMKKGDPIIELVNTFHFGMNEGKETAEIVVVYAGDLETPITVAKLEE